uniref:MYND-type domain-containing protein n=1 Tax=Caenorhabditis japonica TaxID=281687 RepID=A0A8R1HRZ3_CAEJA
MTDASSSDLHVVEQHEMEMGDVIAEQENHEYVDDRTKRLLSELQKHWLTNYHNSREKALVELTERLHQEFLADQQKIRAELLQQFKEELEQTRAELEAKYRDQLKQESTKMLEKHRRELSDAKKKQWCCQCENEAIYHCCWNTAYCSVECQQNHWQNHRRICRRRKSSSGQIPGQ